LRLKPFDSAGECTRDLLGAPATVRGDALRSAGVTVFSGAIGLVIQTIATVVLARLVAPREFGLVTIVTTISMLLASFGDNGLPEAIVRRDRMDHALASNLFWINVTGGLLLAVCFALTGPVFAWAYHDIELKWIAFGIAPMMFFYSTATVHLALLKRAMRFSETSMITICARSVSVVTSILMGLAGYGHWALVAGAVALPASQTAAAWYVCRWVPGAPRRVEGTGSTYWFAFCTYSRFCMGYCTNNTDNILLGLRFSAQALGFYKRAYDLSTLSASQFSSALTLVVVSALRPLDHRSSEYRRLLLAALTTISFLGMGLSATLTVVGRDVILVLLGPRWEESGRIFTFFGPGVGIMVLYYTHGWIHLSVGRADRWLRWGLIEFSVTALLFVAALPWGPVGVAVAWTVSYWLLTFPALWYAGKPIDFEVAPVIRGIWRYIVAGVCASAGAEGIMRHAPWLVGFPGASGALLRIVVGGILVAILYLGTIVVLHGSRTPIYELAALIRQVWPKRNGSRATEETSGESRCAALIRPGRQGDAVLEGPLVSILVPAYNAEKWIASALRSALGQSWPNKEIIVVDDGSTDRTLDILRTFASDSVRVIAMDHRGAAATRNTAYSESRGDYIQWLDADDLLAPDKIERQLAAAKEGASNRTLLSASWATFLYRTSRANFVSNALWCDLPPSEWLIRKMAGKCYIQTGAWLVSRELTEAAGPWNTHLLGDDDGEYFCRVVLKSDLVRFVPESKAYYRHTGPGCLSYIGSSNSKLSAQWLSMKLHIEHLLSQDDSTRGRNACVAYLQRNLIDFYPERPEIVMEAHRLAAELGGELKVPRLPAKYNLLRATLGWTVAKRAQLILPRAKWGVARSWDKTMYLLEG
jgi:O-antigen/teichoic acid export membrane protein/glycosyltransferase involved in cell wall biosynthesis